MPSPCPEDNVEVSHHPAWRPPSQDELGSSVKRFEHIDHQLRFLDKAVEQLIQEAARVDHPLPLTQQKRIGHLMAKLEALQADSTSDVQEELELLRGMATHSASLPLASFFPWTFQRRMNMVFETGHKHVEAVSGPGLGARVGMGSAAAAIAFARDASVALRQEAHGTFRDSVDAMVSFLRHVRKTWLVSVVGNLLVAAFFSGGYGYVVLFFILFTVIDMLVFFPLWGKHVPGSRFTSPAKRLWPSLVLLTFGYLAAAAVPHFQGVPEIIAVLRTRGGDLALISATLLSNLDGVFTVLTMITYAYVTAVDYGWSGPVEKIAGLLKK